MRPPDRSTATAPRPCVTLASTPPRRRVIRLLEQRCRWLCPTPGGWRRRTGAARTPPPARAGRQARAGQGPRARAAARRADDHACRGRAWRGLQARRSPGRYPAADSAAGDDTPRAQTGAARLATRHLPRRRARARPTRTRRRAAARSSTTWIATPGRCPDKNSLMNFHPECWDERRVLRRRGGRGVGVARTAAREAAGPAGGLPTACAARRPPPYVCLMCTDGPWAARVPGRNKWTTYDV